MKILGNASTSVPAIPVRARPVAASPLPPSASEPRRLAVVRQAELPCVRAKELYGVETDGAEKSSGAEKSYGGEKSYDRVARLAAVVLGTRRAFVAIAGERSSLGRGPVGARDMVAPERLVEQSWCRQVIESGNKLIINDARLDPRTRASFPAGPASVTAWAGFPLADPDGGVRGALCVSDDLPRRWSEGEVEILSSLAHIASDEVALQLALEHGAEYAAAARTLKESLLPSRLPVIPGVQVAGRHVAGGRRGEVLGDFYDVFPSVRGRWGLAVGDVCGKGVPAAKSTALARYTLRAEAHRETRPSLILAALNLALLDWLTDDPRFLTAIYATVRPTRAGAVVQVSSAGHSLALVRRMDGRVQELGHPGTLLGLFPEPELHDSQGRLGPGDVLILFTDGVTEARGSVDRDLYGDDRLRDLIAGLGDMSAAQIADAIQAAVQAFSGGQLNDDTVTLVLKVPRA